MANLVVWRCVIAGLICVSLAWCDQNTEGGTDSVTESNNGTESSATISARTVSTGSAHINSSVSDASLSTPHYRYRNFNNRPNFVPPPPYVRARNGAAKYQHPSSIYLRSHSEPSIRIEQLADTGKVIMGELMSGVGQMFQNLFQPTLNARSNFAPVKFLNGEGIIATATRLLPAANRRWQHRYDHIEPSPSIQRVSTQSESNLSGNDTRETSAEETTTKTEQIKIPFHRQPPPPLNQSIDYEAEGKKLREDIVDKVGHLQNILTTALEVSRERRDIITRRLLEQTNYRLNRAKDRAEQILSNPANTELAVKTLHTISHAVNNISTFLHGLLSRINISINVKVKDPVTSERNNDRYSSHQLDQTVLNANSTESSS